MEWGIHYTRKIRRVFFFSQQYVVFGGKLFIVSTQAHHNCSKLVEGPEISSSKSSLCHPVQCFNEILGGTHCYYPFSFSLSLWIASKVALQIKRELAQLRLLNKLTQNNASHTTFISQNFQSRDQ